MQRRFEFKPAKREKTREVKVILYGLGWIGAETARAVLKREELKIVGAVDNDENKVGEDLGELIGSEGRLGVQVTGRPKELFGATEADVVLHTTSSFLKDVYEQLMRIVEAGINVISSTEELLFPFLQNPSLSEELDRLAKDKGVTVLGTGVNPGFVMDTLPLVMTGVCQEIRGIKVYRIVDASNRRGPLQRKIGSSMIPEAFEEMARGGKIGHVGLVESAALIAHGLGWKLDSIEETLEPVISEDSVETKYVRVEKGQVAGIKQTAWGMKDGEKLIVLQLQMYLGADDPHDAVFIDGTPPIDVRIPGGVAGDAATVATLVNSIPRVMKASPGLLIANDLPIPAWHSGSGAW